jgi:hypothetical protein
MVAVITPLRLLTARQGREGLTFFHYQDVAKAEYDADDYRMKLRDARAVERFRSMMAKETRALQHGSVRRQYLVPAARDVRPGIAVSLGLRALHDHETRSGVVTHYRVIWFAEAIDI